MSLGADMPTDITDLKRLEPGEVIDGPEEAHQICEALWRKDVITKLKDFLSTKPAIHQKHGNQIMKNDKTPYMMRELEHALHFKLKTGEDGEYKEWRDDDGNIVYDKNGNPILDGEIIETTSGTEGVVMPQVWEENMISIHTHPTLYFADDEHFKRAMKTPVMRKEDTLDIYNERGNYLAVPHLTSGGDILAYLANDVIAGCLAGITQDAANPDIEYYVLKCYNYGCLSKNQKNDLGEITKSLEGWEDRMRAARKKKVVITGDRAKDYNTWLRLQVGEIRDIFKTVDKWHRNPLMRKLRRNPSCTCSFRFDNI